MNVQVLVKSILIFFFLILLSTAMAQTVRVVSENSGQPIPYVFIYNEDHVQSAHTDLKGMANLSNFKKDQLIYFRHPSYNLLSYSIDQLREMEYEVTMTEDIVSMKEVVISASKWEQDRTEIPNKIVSISGYDIEFNNPQTAADVLERSGQVFVQKSQMGGGSPMIRGFAANRVLIVVDGVRMNNAIFRSGNLQNVINVDPNILEGAEVLFGPGSVIYGSGALGGVMDFHLKDPQLNTNSKWKSLGNIATRYSTANNEFTTHFDVNVFNNRFSSLSSFSVSNFGDLRTGGNRTEKFPDFGKRPWFVRRIGVQDVIINNRNVNEQIPSAYNQYNLLQKLQFKANNRLELGFTMNYSNTSDIPRYDRLIETIESGDPKYGEWYYGPQTWLFTTLKAEIQSDKGPYDKARIILGYQNFIESRNDRRFNDPELRIRTEDVDAYTLNIDLEKNLNENSRLFYGTELLLNQVESNAFGVDIDSRNEFPSSTRYPDGGTDYASLAIYGSYKYSISKRFNLSAGLRYTHIILNSQIEDTTFFDFPFDEIDLSTGAVNGSIGITYSFGDQWQWNGLFSSGFRAPNLDDIGKVFDSEPGIVVVPNPDLDPEYSYNFETSASKIFGDRTRIDAVIFYTLLRDAMVRRPFEFNGQDSIIYDGTLSRVEALVNTGKAYIFGGSLSFQSQLDPYWSLRGNITYAYGEDQVESIPLRHTTPVFGDFGITWKKGKFISQGLMRFNGQRRFSELPPSEQNKTHLYTSDGSLAWYTLNLNFSYSPNNHWEFTTAFENILDKHYRPYSSGISAPGFNWVLGVRGRF